MKLLRILLCLLMLDGALAGGAVAAGEEEYIEEINDSQFIAIGTVFFTKSTPMPGYRAQYTYMGFDGNNLKIKYELIYHADEIEEVEYYMLRTSPNKDTILSVKPLFGEDPAQVTKLLIGIADQFDRISVKEYRGN